MAMDLLDLMSLEDNIVSDDINDYSITLYGQGGSGKSTFANALKRKLGTSVSFFFEPRAKGLGGIKVVECTSWEVFLAYIKQLQKIKKSGQQVPFDNIIIDSSDSAYDKCTTYVMEENDWETLAGDYGARYNAVGSEFKSAISALRTMGFVVTFLTHEKTKEAHDVDNAAFEKSAPIVSNQVQDIVNDQVDFILYLEKVTISDDNGDKKEVRRLWLKNNPYMTLKTPLFGLPDYIEYEYVNEGVDKFIKAFNEGVKTTRKMYSGQSIVEEKKDKGKVVEEKVVESIDIDGESIDGLTLEELQQEATNVRDRLLKTMERPEVVSLLKESLGTANISKCSDEEKLCDFLNEYSK